MQEKHLFEYAVLRVVPRVEREEFINVGLVLYCSKLKFLEVLFELNTEKINALCKETDVAVLAANLEAFKLICVGGKQSGTIGSLDIASRFRWLTATRSTVIQTSRAHAGFCTEPKQTLERLFTDLVL